MSQPLRIERETRDDALFIALAGDLTEDAPLELITPLSGRVVIDLSGIDRTNSGGIREWVRFMGRVPPTTQLVFQAVSPAMVTQANLIAHFLGHGRIASFLAPYFCASCGKTAMVLFDPARDFPNGPTPPNRTCTTCKVEMVFDDVPEQYLAFLTRT